MIKERVKNAVRIVLEALCASLIFAFIMLSILLALGVYLGREAELVADAAVSGDLVAGDLYVITQSNAGILGAYSDDECDFYMIGTNSNTPPAADTFKHILQVYCSSNTSDIIYFCQNRFTTTPSFVVGDMRYNYTGSNPQLQVYTATGWDSSYTKFYCYSYDRNFGIGQVALLNWFTSRCTLKTEGFVNVYFGPVILGSTHINIDYLYHLGVPASSVTPSDSIPIDDLYGLVLSQDNFGIMPGVNGDYATVAYAYMQGGDSLTLYYGSTIAYAYGDDSLILILCLPAGVTHCNLYCNGFVEGADYVSLTLQQRNGFIYNTSILDDLVADLSDNAYMRGYNVGLEAGAESVGDNSLLNLIWTVFDMPFRLLFGTYDNSVGDYVGGIFSFSVLGLDMRALVIGIMSVCLVVAIIKFVLGMRS